MSGRETLAVAHGLYRRNALRKSSASHSWRRWRAHVVNHAQF